MSIIARPSVLLGVIIIGRTRGVAKNSRFQLVLELLMSYKVIGDLRKGCLILDALANTAEIPVNSYYIIYSN